LKVHVAHGRELPLKVKAVKEQEQTLRQQTNFHNAGVVKIHNAKRLTRIENKNNFFYYEKRSSLLNSKVVGLENQGIGRKLIKRFAPDVARRGHGQALGLLEDFRRFELEQLVDVDLRNEDLVLQADVLPPVFETCRELGSLSIKFHRGRKFHTKIPRYIVSYSGKKFKLIKCKQSKFMCKISCPSTKLHTREQSFIPGHKTAYPGRKFHLPMASKLKKLHSPEEGVGRIASTHVN
jgi:hypothetical protein